MKVRLNGREPANLPDFFVVGAAKSGTSSLHYYFDEHPGAFMPEYKESHFFTFMDNPPVVKNNEYLAGVHDLEEYIRIYAGAGDDQKLGDASPGYLYDYKTFFKNIRRVYQDDSQWRALKFIIGLRNPVDRAWSQYWTFRRSLRENLEFDQAIQPEAIAERKSQKKDMFYDYTGFGLYHDQVKAYFDEYGRENVKVFLFEELHRDTLGLCREIFEFVGVDPNFTPRTDVVHNISGKPKSETLYKVLLAPNYAKKILKYFIPRKKRMKIKYAIANRTIDKMKMPEQSRQALKPLFRDDIARLQDLLGKDLSLWMS